MSDETKKCPYCAETIQAAAIVCRYCGRELKEPEKPAPHVVKQGAFATCSECGGYLRPDATLCKHCKATFGWVPQGTIPPPTKPSRALWIIIATVVGLLVLGVLASVGGRGAAPSPFTPDSVSAWVDCREFVTRT